MNCKKIQKGSFKDKIDVESSLTNSSVESICQRNSDADEVEEDIGISHFLDLMKVSCSINDVISVQTTQKVVATGNIPASNTLKDDSYFEKVIDNQLLNDVLVSGRKNEVLGSNIVEVSGTSISGHANDINFTSRRNTRTDGWTIDANSSRDKNIDSRLVRSESAQSKLCKKLDYVINEGMVDSVLSFICPIPVSAAFPNFKSKHKREPLNRKPMTSDNLNSQLLTGCARIVDMECDISTNQTNDIIHEDAKSVRKLTTIRADKKEPEVIIHVCDEVKNTTKDFHCPQKLLVGKMGYFAEITAGQKLDEMDISVHCDIQIFDWLIKWMKLTDLAGSSSRRNSTFKDAESAPHLDANNVIPILVSAGFLQMEPLMIDCLSFCHARLCEVIRCSSNLTCLNDSIINRLSAMFTNLELEMVRDKKERLTPRLWIKLIQSLCEPEPEALRGHFYSLAGLFRCSKCGEYLTNTIKSFIPCQPSNNRLTRWGQLRSSHVRDSLWNMNNFIVQIFKELRSWRRVYWKLWGHCHFLYCCICEIHFPVYKMTWCRLHPLSPNYLESIKDDFISGPIGRYPCCGQKAFRFETFPKTNGCHFRDHSVIAETDRERQILQIMQVITDDCVLSDPPTEYITVTNTLPFWISLQLAPHQFKEGLLPNINEGEIKSKITRKCQIESSFVDDSCSESSGSDYGLNVGRLNSKIKNYGKVDFSSDGCESEQGDVEALHPEEIKKKLKRNFGRYWCGELSARSNQDHQREFEERAIKHIALRINKYKGAELSLPANSPLGGFYMRLESEWKDQLKQRSSTININNSSTHGTGNPKQK